MICTKIGRGDMYEKSVEAYVMNLCPSEKEFILKRLEDGSWDIKIAPKVVAKEPTKEAVEEVKHDTKQISRTGRKLGGRKSGHKGR